MEEGKNAYLPTDPSIVYNMAADEYLVAWTHLSTPSNWDIHGARVKGDGSAVIRSNFAIDSSTDDQDSPAVATNGQARYLVVWQQLVWGDWDIYGVELDANGDAISGP